MKLEGLHQSIFAILAMCTLGCAVHLENKSVSLDRNLDDTFKIVADVTKEAFVIGNSIEVTANVEGTRHYLSGKRTGRWDKKVPIICKKTTNFPYTYNVKWKYISWFFGLPLSRQEDFPEEGEFLGKFIEPNPINVLPNEIRIFIEPGQSRTKQTKVSNYSLGAMTIQNIEILKDPDCYVGACSGFALKEPIPIGEVLECGESVDINVRLESLERQASGILRITTNKGMVDIPLSGKIFRF